MPRGLATVTKAMESKSTSFGPFIQRFRLNDGESAMVRFLEQGDNIAWAYVYQLPPKPGRDFGPHVACLDQNNDGTPCPFKDKLPGSPKIRAYLNLIWRDAPKYKRDENGFVKDSSNKFVQDGVEDKVVLWEVGQRVLTTISSLDADMKGLSSRDFKVVRQGMKLQTNYTIYPVDGEASPMSAADEKLAEGKYDLNEFIIPMSFEDAEKTLSGEPTGADSPEEAIDRAKNANVFLQK